MCGKDRRAALTDDRTRDAGLVAQASACEAGSCRGQRWTQARTRANTNRFGGRRYDSQAEACATVRAC